MSSRPLIRQHPVIEAGDMSADIVSDITIMTTLSMISYGISWAGTAPVGTCTVEVSNDYEQAANGQVLNAGTWTPLPISGAVSGNSGTGFIDVDAIAAYAIRLRYTATSGTGTMEAIINAKVA